ncbi:uncharacterized protein BXZ73DRAFT_99731 [Epithele typhae]|uniref:uncharacterized protein n=1 Tax=Epithele typhae TaxID=378194 RepID=UPI002008C355|nr:uncharacterized protein BXZ73DRAFT_99731 [Epithele typhae]KAH9939050.1 hypothetical protein BXZ73DRAFT_99731 [Epithele typhae]
MIIVNSHPQDAYDVKSPPVPEKHPRPAEAPSPRVESALPPPPPYSPPAGPSRVPEPTPVRSEPIFQPHNPQTVNRFEVFSKHAPVSGASFVLPDSLYAPPASRKTMKGTYFIDPALPSPTSGLSRRMCRKQDRAWGKSRHKSDVHASFTTRHGALTLDLALVAPPFAYGREPTRVDVHSAHGRVLLDVHDAAPSRALDLLVETRHGKITVLLPPAFSGPLVIGTRRGNASLLPGLAARARTLRATDRETLCVVSAPGQPPNALVDVKAADPGQDRALVRSKHGKILIGISGVDREPEAARGGGLFETLGRILESQGAAFGTYVEGQARKLERKLTERGETIARHIDTQVERQRQKTASIEARK